uniref:Uncharacterized protein n=1 Tax=viral metagenome TaxID=1070528 RepID=A0A6C0CA78_9ZZZZ
MERASSYSELVNTLSQNITPEQRAVVLNKLTIMNQNLLNSAKVYAPVSKNDGVEFKSSAPVRAGVPSHRKKDISELQHPSMYNNANNRMPTQIPDFRLSANDHQSRAVEDTYKKKRSQRPADDFFDIDDIIDDFSHIPKNEEISMEDKLKKLNSLHNKIIADKKQRAVKNK